jgi:hypothetical protein
MPSCTVHLSGLRDMNGLVETAREALEPIEPWDEGKRESRKTQYVST